MKLFKTSVVIILIIIILILIFPKEIFKEPNYPKCPNSNEIFTHYPIKLDDLKHIIPLGNLNPPGHTFPVRHMYWNVMNVTPDFQDNDSPEVPVYAPGGLYINNISLMENIDKGTTDYSVSFFACEDISGYFIHFQTLSDKLQQAFDASPNDDCDVDTPGNEQFRNCFREVEVTVEAGEQMGTIGGAGGAYGYDFGLQDFRKEPAIVANEWMRDGFEYTVCPIEYFPTYMQTELFSKVSNNTGENKRTLEPICGTPHQDVPRTAQGVWFRESELENIQQNGYDGSKRMHIALVHDNINPTIAAFSIAKGLESIGINENTYYFLPKISGLVNIDFDEVTANGETYCYEFKSEYGRWDFTILLKMTDATNIQIGMSNNDTCNSTSWELDEFITYTR